MSTPYTSDEVDRINKSKETNDKLEEFFQGKRTEWNKNLAPLFEVVKLTIDTQTSSKIMETQAMCLSYRQILNDQISIFLSKRSKQEVKLKKIRQDKFIFYATGFGVKTNLGEKSLLIDAHIAEDQRNIELIESYVEFLRQSAKNLESLQFTIKNIVDLFNLLR